MSIFKADIDLQKNQLLNPVLHNLPVRPTEPYIEGQMYYDTGKKTAYIWNGSYWAVWGEGSGSQNPEVKQYLLNILNPSTKSPMVFVRLFQNQTVVRIDSHFSTESTVYFNIESRDKVNIQGNLLTQDPIQAVYAGTETTVFINSSLSADSWLYFFIVAGDGTTGTPGEGGPTEPPPDVEITGLLTITITCIIR